MFNLVIDCNIVEMITIHLFTYIKIFIFPKFPNFHHGCFGLPE